MELTAIAAFETERLIPRELADDDWRNVLTYQSHPFYLCYYPLEGGTEEDVRNFVDMYMDQQADKPRHQVSVCPYS